MINSVANGNVFEWLNGTGSSAASGSVVGFEGGSMIGVLVTTVADGDTGAANVEGAYLLPSAGFTGVQGQAVFYDTSAKEITETVNTHTIPAGCLYSDCAAGDANCIVLLNEGTTGSVAATVAAIATVNGSDAATTQALANATKTTVNAMLTALKNAGIMKS